MRLTSKFNKGLQKGLKLYKAYLTMYLTSNVEAWLLAINTHDSNDNDVEERYHK